MLQYCALRFDQPRLCFPLSRLVHLIVFSSDPSNIIDCRYSLKALKYGHQHHSSYSNRGWHSPPQYHLHCANFSCLQISPEKTSIQGIHSPPTYTEPLNSFNPQQDTAFGLANGCLPMGTSLPSRWPFALDILKKQYDALPSQRLLAFQSQYFDQIGLNMKFGLFGQESYLTIDPKNIEAILCTHFEGSSLSTLAR